jgi:hypothetical protein
MVLTHIENALEFASAEWKQGTYSIAVILQSNLLKNPRTYPTRQNPRDNPGHVPRYITELRLGART